MIMYLDLLGGLTEDKGFYYRSRTTIACTIYDTTGTYTIGGEYDTNTIGSTSITYGGTVLGMVAF